MKISSSRTIAGSTFASAAIVGRPNVGKSSLFNAILNARVAIVHEAPGVTRDRIGAPVICNGKCFQLFDTGGLGMLENEKKSVDFWNEGIRRQVETAIGDAEVIIMVVDVTAGVLPLDREVAERLRKSGKKVILVATKADNEMLEHQALNEDFTALGFGEALAVSSLHKRNIEELSARIIHDMGSQNMVPVPDASAFRIAVFGRPNVGKSSIVNRLLGEDRVMVSEQAGTTRDAVDTPFSLRFRGENRPAILIDTAGLRRRAKVDGIIEYFSNKRVESALRSCDMALFVTEAAELGALAQDRVIAKMVVDAGKACVVIVNKTDTMPKKTIRELEDEFRATLPHLAYAPMVFLSAKTGANFSRLLDTIALVMETLETQISTGLLNRTLEEIVARTAPPVIKHSPFKIYYATMTDTRPPTFLLFANRADNCAPNYKAYLERALREKFGIEGVPVRIEVKARPKTVESIRTRQVRNKTKATFSKRDSADNNPEREGGKNSKRVGQGKMSRQVRVRKPVTARQKSKKK